MGFNLFEIQEADEIEQRPEPKECKGLFYRASISCIESATDGSFSIIKKLRPLSKLSCLGCSKCDWIVEDFREYSFHEEDYFPSNMKHGEIYQLKVTHYYTDYFGETDYDIEFVKVDSI